MNYIISASTDIGISKSINQDSFNARIYNTNFGKIAFAVICDGMGGLSRGEVASSSLVNAFCKWSEDRLPILFRNTIDDSDIRKEWTDILTRYNVLIRIYGQKNGIKLGTTVTALLITENRYYISNVGDTRAYEITTENANKLTQDQTVIAQAISAGIMTEEEAKISPERNVLTQCIGASEVINPDFFFGDTKKDAVYMLCSDGFRHEISEKEIYDFLNPNMMFNADNMKQNIDILIETNKQRKETDNISAIAIRTF